MEDPVIIKIKKCFDREGSPAKIPLMNGKKLFTARLEEDGIYVDNLGNQPFLPWEAFSEAINCLKENGGQVKKGNATDSRLGDSNLDLNTMEGYIASKVYGYKIGDSVFKRITPIASILAWAEICENSRGQIRLLSEKEELCTPEKGGKAPPVHSLGKIKEIGNQLARKDEETAERHESEHIENEIVKDRITAEFSKKMEDLSILEGRLLEKEKDLEKLKEIIAIKDRDLQVLAEKFIAADSEIRKVEEKLLGREKKINNLEIALATSEEKIKKFEKQLSDLKGEEKLAVQLREKEELIRQLKGTLASKEEEFSRLNEENRRYKRQQKFESEGLKQIEEQKTSKKWWKHW